MLRNVDDLITITFYPGVKSSHGDGATTAREGFARVLGDFIVTADEWHKEAMAWPKDKPTAPVWCAKVTTGGGKTRITAKELSGQRLAYLVPTHRLGEDIAELFRRQRMSAVVLRGRDATNPATGKKMCSWLPQVELALAANLSVEQTCCKKSEKQKCPFYDRCAYQLQFQEAEESSVAVAAHETAFHASDKLKGFWGLVIDEDHWACGIRISKEPLRISDIEYEPAPAGVDVGEVMKLRKALATALSRQTEAGGLRRECVSDVTKDECIRAIKLEWDVINRAAIGIAPGMTLTQIRALSSNWLPWIRTARKVLAIWYAVRDMLGNEDIQASGRIGIEAGRVKLRSLKSIAKQWQIPTLIMSATLPRLEILRAFHEQAQIVSEIDIEMPHATVTQIVRAPVSQKKLGVDRNMRHMRRLILQEWVRTGRGQMLVIAQKAFANWLRTEGRLPSAISVEHLNAIEGLDGYKNVRHLMVIGRTMPTPEAVEAMAGAITGVEPAPAEIKPNGSTWYRKAVRGIRMRDGSLRPIEADEHPDPVAEAVRWQICEGELIQAIGRARGVNRTAQNRVNITVVADIALPVVADTVVEWEAPSEAVEMAAEGVMLTSGADMARCWPAVWESRQAAEPTLEDIETYLGTVKALGGRPASCRTTLVSLYQELFDICPFEAPLQGNSDNCPLEGSTVRVVDYQPAGARHRPRRALFDSAVVPDPAAWLTARLGPLARCKVSLAWSAPTLVEVTDPAEAQAIRLACGYTEAA